MRKLTSTVTQNGCRNMNRVILLVKYLQKMKWLYTTMKLLKERLMKTYQVTSSSKGSYVQLPIA